GADLRTARIDHRTLARGQAPLDGEADAAGGRALGKFLLHPVGADEAALKAAALGHGKTKAGGNHADAGVQIMAVEGKARLQPQRVAGAKAVRLDLRLIT